MEIGQDGASRLHAFYPAERVIDTEMAGMGSLPQSVHHPDIQPLQGRDAGRWQATEIA